MLQGFLLGLLFSFVVLSFVSHRCSCPKRKVAEPSFLHRHPCSPTYPPFPAPSQPVPRRSSEDNRTVQPTIKSLSPRLLCLVLTSPTTLITRLHCYMSIVLNIFSNLILYCFRLLSTNLDFDIYFNIPKLWMQFSFTKKVLIRGAFRSVNTFLGGKMGGEV